MKVLQSYFPDLTPEQDRQFSMLGSLYADWNEKINVISRKDIDQLYIRHVLHSLAIAKVIQFEDDTKILDIGTGGGFPGIPLAILFPNCKFTLVDSIGKKIKVVNAIAEELGLNNVIGLHERGENLSEKYDFVVSRAVTRLNKFLPWTKGKFTSLSKHELANGIIYLKGGDIEEELKETKRKTKSFPISDFFDDPFFDTKYVVHITMT